MNRTEFLEKMKTKGKITEAQFTDYTTKDTAKNTAKEKYNAGKAKLTKTELMSLLETLTN